MLKGNVTDNSLNNIRIKGNVNVGETLLSSEFADTATVTHDTANTAEIITARILLNIILASNIYLIYDYAMPNKFRHCIIKILVTHLQELIQNLKQ